MPRNQNDENLVLGISGSSLVTIQKGLVIEENGTANVSITNVAPASVGTATISKWLKVFIGGTAYYIPLWT